MNPGFLASEEALKSFIREDIGHADITSDALVDPEMLAEASILAGLVQRPSVYEARL